MKLLAAISDDFVVEALVMILFRASLHNEAFPLSRGYYIGSAGTALRGWLTFVYVWVRKIGPRERGIV